RVSNEKLTAAVFDYMRTWTFSLALNPVQLRCTLLFIPPDTDQTSILLWEKRLGNRFVEDRGRAMSPPPPLPAVAAAAPMPEKTPPPLASSRSGPTEAPRVPLSAWYRVTNPAPLHAAPKASSEVITHLRKGTRIQVTALVGGEWLEVHSVNNRPPGFLW